MSGTRRVFALDERGRRSYVRLLSHFLSCSNVGNLVNLLLLLTALLTSIAGMISGDRAGVSRAPAAAVAAERVGIVAQVSAVSVAVTRASRPATALPGPRQTNTPLPRPFEFALPVRVAAERRRE